MKVVYVGLAFCLLMIPACLVAGWVEYRQTHRKVRWYRWDL